MRISLGVALLIAPASFAAQEDAPHWSLRPLVEPDVPQLEGWGRNRVDGFVAEALARQGLSPSPEADRATLIRRLTFDLWGLPPTRAEVDAFLADDRSDAYGRLVDRLLASRHYAERQAQHWLDVARYGDTHGFDKDKRRPHAWRYRDWVVDAFDRDLTWAEFLARQLAGDVLDPGGPDVAGTGFLAAGPWDFVGHVELREGTVDKALTRHLDRDEVAGAVLAAFASTTVSCARCHDHKFDPIPIAEYYALQSVFAGIERADVAFDADPDAARMRRLLEAEVAARRAEITRYEADLAGVSSPEIELLDERLAGVERQRLPAQWTTSTLAEGGGRRLGYHSQIAPSPDVAKWVQVDLGASLFFDEVALWPSNETFGLWEGAGFGFPVRFSVLVGDAPDLSDARVLFSLREQDLPNHGDTPFVVTGDGQAARYVRVVVHKLWGRATAGSTDYCFALAELSVREGAAELATGKAVTHHDSIEAGGDWGARLLTDGVLGGTTFAHLAEFGDPLTLLEGQIEAFARSSLYARQRNRAAIAMLGDQRAGEVAWSRIELEGAAASLARLPARARVYAAATEFTAEGNFRPPPNGPRPVHVLERGSVGARGEEVTPGPLGLAGLGTSFDLAPDHEEGQRRLALARWLADPEHPLTWRSAANRLWQWRFGVGLVATSSDFGRMGDAPTHPELLDWLARRLRDTTPKALTRLIVTSATYRQASVDRPEALAVDADNRFLWRGARRRLDSETLHDSLLAVSGELDLTGGGPPFDRFAFEDDHSPRYLYDQLDPGAPAAHRRALYRAVVRSVPDPWFATFDCPDPSLAAPQRRVTTTPLQALALFNSSFVLARAEALARRVEDSADPIAEAFHLAVGRAPSARERDALRGLVEDRSLAAACRVILNSNAFLYVD